MNGPMNLLVTLNEAYVPHLNVMLTSLLRSNPETELRVYLLHDGIAEEALLQTRALLGDRGKLLPVRVQAQGLEDAPTSGRYPREMYYRIFAAKYLPETLDRVLYLDPDVIVNGSLAELYGMELGDHYFAAASHVKGLFQKVNELRLDMDGESPYINSGVLLMNLALLRREQREADVFAFIESHKNALLLPDQDVISSLYGHRILPLDPYRYNMTERLYALRTPAEWGVNLEWIRENTVIIHYCGRNKPWKKHYVGKLDFFYLEAAAALENAAK